MTKKTQVTKPIHRVSAKQSDPVMKLIKQIGAKDIATDVINAIISPLINLITTQGDVDA